MDTKKQTGHMMGMGNQLEIANDAAKRMMDGLEREDWLYVRAQLSRQVIALGNARWHADVLALLKETETNGQPTQ